MKPVIVSIQRGNFLHVEVTDWTALFLAFRRARRLSK